MYMKIIINFGYQFEIRNLTNNEWRPYICDKPGCGRGYKYKSGLFRHVKYECGKEPQFPCVVCHKRFTQQQSLKSHMIYIHGFPVYNKQKNSESNSSYCLLCVDSRNGRFYCINMCGRSYKQKTHMTRHVNYECGQQKKFKCKYCSKKFYHKDALQKHEYSLHSEQFLHLVTYDKCTCLYILKSFSAEEKS
ncbi:zinc finger protein 39-like [Daktulosphaira vitifoliae]|uniref:zinc finger protein 39-like n=1 Tax=Daktulosphaira vitifoliae TaxID=58002 RepID=UPI0021AA3921|nr:zinc finger protein 39-like [Daktulosphaira vitifoliae]